MWDAINWTMAGQVTALFDLGKESARLLDEEESPAAFFDKLCAGEHLNDAISFLAFALPRRSAIDWGHACVGASQRFAEMLPPDMAAYSAAGAWLDDASEERRWVAHDVGRQADTDKPEALLAMAVFVSGGSITPANSPQQVPSPPDLVGRLIGGAVTLAAMRLPPDGAKKAKADFLRFGAHFAEGTEPTTRLDPDAWAGDMSGHAASSKDREPHLAAERPTISPRVES